MALVKPLPSLRPRMTRGNVSVVTTAWMTILLLLMSMYGTRTTTFAFVTPLVEPTSPCRVAHGRIIAASSPRAALTAAARCHSQLLLFRGSRSSTKHGKRSRHGISSSVEGDFDADAIAQSRSAIESGSIRAKVRALYKFTRPHTIRGTILASICGTIRALLDTPGWASALRLTTATSSSLSLNVWTNLLPRALVGMMALLCGNAFIVGINQIYDEDIDKVNKPFLPVASGELTKRNAWVIVLASVIVGPLLVYRTFPTLLFQLYTLGLGLGTIYSVPPWRTKQNPILAGLTIAVVRGFLLNFGVYYAVKDAIPGAIFFWSPKVTFIARFMTIFATIIAVTKDLPDIEGDKKFQIETFATKIGVARIAQGASLCLLLNYVHAVATGLLAKPGVFRAVPMIGGHAVLAAMLVYRFTQLQPNSMASVKRFYKNIWDLFYLEYGLYTLI